MAGGSLGLASSTASGLDLTNVRPQVTFFRKVFKRHTNFGIESVQQSNISGTANFGNTILITIENMATLLTDMHFEFTLPPAAGENGQDSSGTTLSGSSNGIISNFKDYASWVNGVGYAIIESCELIIDGNTIDRHTGLWFDIWNELTDQNRKEWEMVGKREENDNDPPNIITNTRYYVPLQFFFNRNPGLALPIFIIGENKLKIKIKFNSLINLLLFNVNPDPDNSTTINTNASISGFKFFTTYIYLEEEEEIRIRNALPAEYLIETLSRNGPINSSSNISNIQFENPTKEFIWVFRHNSRIAGPSLNGNSITGNPPIHNKPFTNNVSFNDIFNYSGIGINTTLNYGTFDTFSSLTLKIRNQNRFDETDSTFFRTMQPYKHHSNIPGGVNRNFKKKFIYVYSFALNPEEYQPSGSYNFGRLNDRTSFEFKGHDFTNFKLELFSVKYEYLIITNNSVTLSSVPTQTYVESSLELEDNTESQTKGKTAKAVSKEIKKRYTAEIPHLHVHEHAHIHKKKWSGLQGNVMSEKKKSDLGQ